MDWIRSHVDVHLCRLDQLPCRCTSISWISTNINVFPPTLHPWRHKDQPGHSQWGWGPSSSQGPRGSIFDHWSAAPWFHVSLYTLSGSLIHIQSLVSRHSIYPIKPGSLWMPRLLRRDMGRIMYHANKFCLTGVVTLRLSPLTSSQLPGFGEKFSSFSWPICNYYSVSLTWCHKAHDGYFSQVPSPSSAVSPLSTTSPLLARQLEHQWSKGSSHTSSHL